MFTARMKRRSRRTASARYSETSIVATSNVTYDESCKPLLLPRNVQLTRRRRYSKSLKGWKAQIQEREKSDEEILYGTHDDRSGEC